MKYLQKIWRSRWPQLKCWLRRPTTTTHAYTSWITQRIKDRQRIYQPWLEENLFSIVTAVFDPPVTFLRELSHSILTQDYRQFEWIIVDNACQNPSVLTELDQLTKDRRVRIFRSSHNRGIMGGLRLALEKATCRYIVPVDHDDRLYPDALRVIAQTIQAFQYPPLLYTDEDKILPEGQVDHPFCKPDWDPLLFCNCCYTAHLGVMDRELALAFDCYKDEQAQGCPDWDAFSRFVSQGKEPMHCPEILYSWRMHAQSTATPGQNAKPYTIAGQHHLLERLLEDRGLADQLTIRANALYGDVGMWRIALKYPSNHQSSPCVEWNDAWDCLERAYQLAATNEWIEFRSSSVQPLTTRYVDELAALFAFDEEIVCVGPCLIDQSRRIRSAGLIFGMDGLLGSPLVGKPFGDFAGYGMLINQHTVSAVRPEWSFIRGAFFRSIFSRFRKEGSLSLWAAWLGAYARMYSKRIVFTPHIVGYWRDDEQPSWPHQDEMVRFLQSHWMVLSADPTYSIHLSLKSDRAFQLADQADRLQSLRRALCPLAGI